MQYAKASKMKKFFPKESKDLFGYLLKKVDSIISIVEKQKELVKGKIFFHSATLSEDVSEKINCLEKCLEKFPQHREAMKLYFSILKDEIFNHKNIEIRQEAFFCRYQELSKIKRLHPKYAIREYKKLLLVVGDLGFEEDKVQELKGKIFFHLAIIGTTKTEKQKHVKQCLLLFPEHNEANRLFNMLKKGIDVT